MEKNSGDPDKRKRFLKWATIGTIILVIWVFMLPKDPEAAPVSYTEFLAEIESGNLKEVTVDEYERTMVGKKETGSLIGARYTGEENIAEMLRAKGVKVKVIRSEPGCGSIFLGSWLPTLLVIVVFIWLFRSLMAGRGGGMGAAGNFTKSGVRREDPNQINVYFRDVKGADETVEEVREPVDFLRNPRKYQHLGVRVPKGVMIMGPPGCGKTLLARAIACESGVPFFSISGSAFVEMFVGVGAGRVRDMFETVKKNAPAILFIDEIDAVGRVRGSGLGGGHDEREQTLNQLLVEMDGFDASAGIILIAASNRPDVLDPALLRPGRFDRRVVMPLPDVRGRREIIELYASQKPLAEDVDLDALSRLTVGCSGADLENLVNEAALNAARNDQEAIAKANFEYAFDKVLMGPERKLVISDKNKRNTAFHEAGHAVVGLFTKEADDVHKVTIIPRGRALGLTLHLPKEDVTSVSQSEAIARIKVSLGGRAAEQLVGGETTTGCENDLENATELAKKMVMKWGMSEELGPVSYGKSSGPVFLGRDMAQQTDYSEDTAKQIDEAVRGILRQLSEEVSTLLTKHRSCLDAVAEALIEHETLDRDQLEEIKAACPGSSD